MGASAPSSATPSTLPTCRAAFTAPAARLLGLAPAAAVPGYLPLVPALVATGFYGQLFVINLFFQQVRRYSAPTTRG